MYSGLDISAGHSLVSRRDTIYIVWKIPIIEGGRRHWTCNYNRMEYISKGKKRIQQEYLTESGVQHLIPKDVEASMRSK